MRLSEVSRVESELPADSLPAGDQGRLTTARADQPDRGSSPGPDWPGRDRPAGSPSLADRLARLPAAHPSAWSPADRTAAVQADTRRGGDAASADTWWRGESDIWWRVRDGSDGETDFDDDVGGLGDPGEFADFDDLADAGGLAEADWEADADWAADDGVTGDADDQGGGTRGARAARRAPDAGRRGDVPWEGASSGGPGRSGRDHGPYRPWFSTEGSGDPWFAAGRQFWVDS